MKIKVSEATPNQLDWMVAKCLQVAAPKNNPLYWKAVFSHWGDYRGSTRFSTEWAQGGPIVEREGLTVSEENQNPVLWSSYLRQNLFKDDGSEHWQTGPTPLIAAMRCYVASKLGDEVEIPEDLK